MQEIKVGSRVRSLFVAGEVVGFEGAVISTKRVNSHTVMVFIDPDDAEKYPHSPVVLLDYQLECLDPEEEEPVGAPDPVHLWEVEHDCWGADHMYYANGYQNADWNTTSESWADFISSGAFGQEGLDLGLNFLYRWDWEEADPEWLEEGEYAGDFLHLFWVLPRKGVLASNTIRVEKSDEAAVREWLGRFAEYMARMWVPLSLSLGGV